MKPTYLYIKQHTITGKLYFGKTTKPEKKMLQYNGSGIYWKSHIKTYGKEHVITLWYCLFYEELQLVEFATSYCKLHNIGYGDTSIWANQKPENGLDGGTKETGQASANVCRDRKVNAFFDPLLRTKISSIGGKVQGQRNRDSGHCKKISNEYWNKVKSGEIIRIKKRNITHIESNKTIQIEVGLPLPDGYREGRAKLIRV